MLGLIALALIILACSYKKSPNNSSNDDAEEEKSAKPVRVLQPEWEPRIVVIMAGDNNPTYLAEPVSAIRLHEQV